MSQLPYVELTKEQKASQKQIMCSGNTVLKQWHAAARKNYDGKRFSRSKFRGMLFEKLKGRVCRIYIFGLWIKKSDIEKIVAVQNAQGEILLGYTRMLTTVCDNFMKQDLPPIIEFDDLYDEAVVALLRATFFFTKKSLSFSTYAHHCVYRRLAKFIVRSYPMTKRTPADADLYREYEHQKQQLNAPASFDEIVELMNLDKKQRASLESMLVKVFRQDTPADTLDESNDHNEIFFASQYNGDRGNYFSAGRSSNQPIYKKEDGLEVDMLAAVRDANLSELERATLEGFLEGAGRGAGAPNGGRHGTSLGKSGWMLEVAATQGVSRMAVTYAFRRVKKKILETYSQEEFEKLLSGAAA